MLAKYVREGLNLIITQQMLANNNDKSFHIHGINKNNNNEFLIKNKDKRMLGHLEFLIPECEKSLAILK